MTQILNWIVPFLLAAGLAGGVALVRMWSKQDRQADEQARLNKRVEKLEERADGHDEGFSSQAVMLATMNEGIEWIKRALESVLGARKDRQ